MKVKSQRQYDATHNFPDVDDSDLLVIDPTKFAKAANHFAQQYSQPVSVLREILQNALEAHMEYGIDRKVRVTMPAAGATDEYHDDDNNMLIVQDFAGLTEQQARSIMFSPMASTKDDDDNFAGGFGIGALSPLYIAPSFMVTTALDGVLTQFEIIHTPKGLASPVTMRAYADTNRAEILQADGSFRTVDDMSMVTSWNGENGTTVEVPIPSNQVGTLRHQCSGLIRFYDPALIEITNDDWGQNIGSLAPGKGKKYGRLELFSTANTDDGAAWHAIVRGVPYPLNNGAYNDLMPADTLGVIYLNPEEVTVARSRESLTVIPETMDAINSIFRDASVEAEAELELLCARVLDDVRADASLANSDAVAALVQMDKPAPEGFASTRLILDEAGGRKYVTSYWNRDGWTIPVLNSLSEQTFAVSAPTALVVHPQSNANSRDAVSALVDKTYRTSVLAGKASYYPAAVVKTIVPVNTGDAESATMIREVARALNRSVPSRHSQGYDDADDAGILDDGMDKWYTDNYFILVPKNVFDAAQIELTWDENQKNDVHLTRKDGRTDLTTDGYRRRDGSPVGSLADLMYQLGDDITVMDTVEPATFFTQMDEWRKGIARQARARRAATGSASNKSDGGPSYDMYVWEWSDDDDAPVYATVAASASIGGLAAVLDPNSYVIVTSSDRLMKPSSPRVGIALQELGGDDIADKLRERPLVILDTDTKNEFTAIKRAKKALTTLTGDENAANASVALEGRMPSMSYEEHTVIRYLHGDNVDMDTVASLTEDIHIKELGDWFCQDVDAYHTHTVSEDDAAALSVARLCASKSRPVLHTPAMQFSLMSTWVEDELGVTFRNRVWDDEDMAPVKETVAKLLKAGLIQTDVTDLIVSRIRGRR